MYYCPWAKTAKTLQSATSPAKSRDRLGNWRSTASRELDSSSSIATTDFTQIRSIETERIGLQKRTPSQFSALSSQLSALKVSNPSTLVVDFLVPRGLAEVRFWRSRPPVAIGCRDLPCIQKSLCGSLRLEACGLRLATFGNDTASKQACDAATSQSMPLNDLLAPSRPMTLHIHYDNFEWGGIPE